MSIELLILLMGLHWLADFVLQNDKMALNKSKSNYWLGLHCLVYGLVFGVVFTNPLFGLVAGASHFAIDYVTSRMNSYFWSNDKRHEFFVCIGADQFAHLTLLFWTAKLFLL